MDFKVGDIVWYVPRGYPIAIECTITEVDDEFRKQDPKAYLFYWIDEVVGNALADDEFCLTKEEALEFIKKEYPDLQPITLEDYRKKRATFIVSTHGVSEKEIDQDVKEFLRFCPNKTGKWFTVNKK